MSDGAALPQSAETVSLRNIASILRIPICTGIQIRIKILIRTRILIRIRVRLQAYRKSPNGFGFSR